MKGIVDAVRSGLMQFHFTHPRVRAAAITTLGSEIVWVGQPVKQNGGSGFCCTQLHERVWPIALDFVPHAEEMRLKAKLLDSGASDITVCSCQGRVIE